MWGLASCVSGFTIMGSECSSSKIETNKCIYFNFWQYTGVSVSTTEDRIFGLLCIVVYSSILITFLLCFVLCLATPN